LATKSFQVCSCKDGKDEIDSYSSSCSNIDNTKIWMAKFIIIINQYKHKKDKRKDASMCMSKKNWQLHQLSFHPFL